MRTWFPGGCLLWGEQVTGLQAAFPCGSPVTPKRVLGLQPWPVLCLLPSTSHREDPRPSVGTPVPSPPSPPWGPLPPAMVSRTRF